MKLTVIAAATLLLVAAPAFAQSNATVQGQQTAPGNASGAPEAASPAGQVGGSAVLTPTAPAPAGDRAAQQQPSTSEGQAVTTLPGAPGPAVK